jgi:DNA-binding response OmpR family regulator
MKQRILIVDDDLKICSLLEDVLLENGFKTDTAHTTEEAWESIAVERPNLILLDVEVPMKGGLQFCREIKIKDSMRNIPVIFLTVKDQEIDKVCALDLGGDDFVTKPFRPKELAARIRVVLRRYEGEERNFRMIKKGSLLIDFSKRKIQIKNQEVHLTPKEFEVLEFLQKNHDRAVSDRMIFEAVWGSNSRSSLATVYTHIDRLRKKLGVYEGFIKTVSGMGYRFDEN